MKRIIAGMIGAAVLGGAVVAQEVTFYNRMGSVLVNQPAVENADADFGRLYDRIVGQYDSEKFSFFGRFEAELMSNDGWDEHIGLGLGFDPEFNGAMRPLPFLEIALGNSYGTETPWEGYELPGSYGYGSDVTYGRGLWADGNGGTILFKGAGIGMDGLYIGWNILPITNARNGGFKGKGFPDGWDTQLGLIYNVDGLLGIGVGAKLSTRKWTEGEDRNANQQIGVYIEYTGVENLKVGAGVTMDTNSLGAAGDFIHESRGDELGFELGPISQYVSLDRHEYGFVPFVNAGAEYNFAGMGLPITLGADVGLYAGAQTVVVNPDDEDVTMMPMLVGLLVRVDPMENLWFDVRAVYEDALLKGVPDGSDINLSRLTVTPRVHFLLSESDEFRLQVPIMTNWIPETKAGGNFETSTHTGFNIGVFWQHNF